ncbi:hypothetical protein Tco_0869183, partial [Tanacetum coccineum]
CGQWQLSGLPCGHLIAVMRHLRQSSANQFAFSCFKTSVWRASYNEVIYDVGHPSEWDKPDGLITVLPPVMDKRLPGRPRNRDRFRSKGEQITQKSCTRCFKGGHNRRDCPRAPRLSSRYALITLTFYKTKTDYLLCTPEDIVGRQSPRPEIKDRPTLYQQNGDIRETHTKNTANLEYKARTITRADSAGEEAERPSLSTDP